MNERDEYCNNLISKYISHIYNLQIHFEKFLSENQEYSNTFNKFRKEIMRLKSNLNFSLTTFNIANLNLDPKINLNENLNIEEKLNNTSFFIFLIIFLLIMIFFFFKRNQ